jgi:hypothetical protein
MPYLFTVTGARASVKVAQTSGSRIAVYPYQAVSGSAFFLSPYLTIDNGELTSATASSPLALDTGAANIPSDTWIKVLVTAGDGTARGLRFTLLGYQP